LPFTTFGRSPTLTQYYDNHCLYSDGPLMKFQILRTSLRNSFSSAVCCLIELCWH